MWHLSSSNDIQAARVPIFKKGKKEDPGNYRPVRLISVHGKIMEKIILGVIEEHLKQSAFKGKVLFNELNLLL